MRQEGCYSHVIASTPNMRVKFASKAFADWSDDREFYVVDGVRHQNPRIPANSKAAGKMTSLACVVGRAQVSAAASRMGATP